MGKPVVDWNNTEAWQRLVAAIIASGVKLDLRKTALYYGTTYDTLENRLRKIKKDAATLQQEVDSGQRSEVVARTKSATNTPKKKSPGKVNGALDTVTNGRVTKSVPKKPSLVKQEQFENDFPFLDGAYDNPSSFDDAPISFDLSNYDSSFQHASILGPDDSFSLN